MSRTIAVPTVVLALGSAVALAACGSTAPKAASSSAAPTVSAAPPSSSTNQASVPAAGSGRASGASSAVVLRAQSSSYGKILFDPHGRVLYLFASDRANTSSCYGACANTWPPYTVSLASKAGVGVRSPLVGTTRRHDGSLQVTYAGHPLYYFTGDTKPGLITCQNASEFGGLWLVVSPNGAAVH